MRRGWIGAIVATGFASVVPGCGSDGDGPGGQPRGGAGGSVGGVVAGAGRAGAQGGRERGGGGGTGGDGSAGRGGAPVAGAGVGGAMGGAGTPDSGEGGQAGSGESGGSGVAGESGASGGGQAGEPAGGTGGGGAASGAGGESLTCVPITTPAPAEGCLNAPYYDGINVYGKGCQTDNECDDPLTQYVCVKCGACGTCNGYVGACSSALAFMPACGCDCQSHYNAFCMRNDGVNVHPSSDCGMTRCASQSECATGLCVARNNSLCALGQGYCLTRSSGNLVFCP